LPPPEAARREQAKAQSNFLKAQKFFSCAPWHIEGLPSARDTKRDTTKDITRDTTRDTTRDITGDTTRSDPARSDPNRPDPTRPDPTRPTPTPPDPTRPTRPGPTRPDPTRDGCLVVDFGLNCVLLVFLISGDGPRTGAVLRHENGVTKSEGRQSAFTFCDSFFVPQNGPRSGATTYQGANHVRTMRSPNGSWSLTKPGEGSSLLCI